MYIFTGVVVFSVFSIVACFNLDTSFPIVYVDPKISKYAKTSTYFGYSLVLYSGDRQSAPWVMIGAPKGNDATTHYKNSGIIYICHVKEPCRKVNNQFTTGYDIIRGRRVEFRLDNAFIGGSMDINYFSKRIVVCGHKWTVNIHDYLAFGGCYWSHINDNETATIEPLFTTENSLIVYTKGKTSVYYHGQGTAGFSAELTNDKQLILGAPGVYSWTGTNILYSDLKDDSPIASKYRRQRSIKVGEFENINAANPIITSQVDAFDFTGYSVTSGYFYGPQDLIFVSSGPRAKKLNGQVLLFRFGQFNSEKMEVFESKEGTQLGEYFGASVTTGDINNDGFDDLIVGSPYYTSEKYNEGRIHVFFGHFKGPLREPNEGSIINGLVVNGMFGFNVKYLGDLNHDGFGDIAVSSPNELDGSGVVYIYKGTRNGLQVTPSQRIVGKDIVPNIRGFGVGLARPADIDNNKYLDLAIGAYQSGHVVVLRGRVIVAIYHTITSTTKQLKHTDKSFIVTACVRVEPQVLMGDVQLNVRRILVADEERGRAKVHQQDQVKMLSLKQGEMFCEKITLDLTVKKKADNNYYEPIKVSLSHELVDENKKHSVIFIGKSINGTDDYCVRCPVYDMDRSSKKRTLSIPFALECGDDNVCMANLEIIAQIENIGNNHEFILGSQDSITLTTRIRNKGEHAYLTQLLVSLPEQVTFRQYLSGCVQDGSSFSSVLCDIDNPLVQNSEKPIPPLELDMKNINNGGYGDSFVISLTVLTSSQNLNSNTKNITVKIVREADITISGKSGEQSYYYGNITHGKPNFTQIFEVNKIGHSPLDEVAIEILIPHSQKSKPTEHFLHLYPPEGYLGGQPIRCRSNFSYIIENKFNEELLIDDNLQQGITDDLLISSRNREKRQIADSEYEIFHNASVSKEFERVSTKEEHYNLMQNRTLYINCSRDDIICSPILCFSGPYKRDQSNAVLQIKMELDTASLKSLVRGKDIIVLSTYGSVSIKNPPDFIQSGDRPDSATVTSLFVGDTKQVIQIWIIIVSVIVGLLLLLLIVLGLVKAGFFKRKKKEELEHMISKAQHETQKKGAENELLSDE